MKGIVSILKEALKGSGWEVVDTPYYEQGPQDVNEDQYDDDLPTPSPQQDDEKVPPIDVKDNADYFIDGVMHTAIVGYIHNSKHGTFPLLAGDVVACCGELYKKAFSIIKHNRAFLLAYPDLSEDSEERTLSEIIENIKSRLTKSFNRLTKSANLPVIPFIPLHYPTDDSHRKSPYAQAREAIRKHMQEKEKELLDGIVTHSKNAKKDYHVYIDGRFQKEDERYKASKVISICKQMSLPDIEKRYHLKVTDVTTLKEGDVTKIYQCAEGGNWRTWFMRLRQHSLPDRDRAMSDIIECTIMSKNARVNTHEKWGKRLSSLAYPTCYGMDKKRWRTHIYPIYLTELYGKQKQLSIELFNKLIYG